MVTKEEKLERVVRSSVMGGLKKFEELGGEHPKEYMVAQTYALRIFLDEFFKDSELIRRYTNG